MTRPTAMAPDASTSPVEWGPEIRVDGRRPAWLDNDEPFLPCSGPGPHREWSCAYSDDGMANWGLLDGIRLPANHPHYSKAPTTPELDPALWDWMVGLVRRMALKGAGCDASTNLYLVAGDFDEARAIFADLLKEPVDPDDQYAQSLLDQQGWSGEGPIGEAAVLSIIAKAHRDGRELAGERA